MSIEELSMGDPDSALWLIYGGWGVGKTYSFRTLPGKTMIVMAELKNIKRVLGTEGNYEMYPLAVIEDGKIRNRTFDEFMNQMNEWLLMAQSGAKPFDNLCLDSLSELQSLYGEKIEDVTFERRLEEASKGKRDKKDQMIDKFQKELKGFGVLNSAMGRTTKMLQKFSWFGINVICTAGVPDDSEGWGSVKPYLIGKEYPSLLAGYFDFVGYVTPNEGENPYPPIVRFGKDPSFKSKCGDTRLEQGGGPLDWTGIFKLIKTTK